MRHVAIIGSGPAGYYTAEALQKRFGDEVRVDVIDRMPVPFGLIRFGVAPDHQSIKAVSRRYEKVALSDNVRFAGNVLVGRDVSVAELLDLYDYYVHGQIDRRTFLQRAGKFAVGGLTAASLLEMLSPQYVLAAQVPKEDARVKTGYLTFASPAGHGEGPDDQRRHACADSLAAAASRLARDDPANHLGVGVVARLRGGVQRLNDRVMRSARDAAQHKNINYSAGGQLNKNERPFSLGLSESV